MMPVDTETWMPIYYAIANDLGIDPLEDANASNILSDLLSDNPDIAPRGEVLDEVSQLLMGKRAYVFGSGPDLEEELDRFTTERLSALKGKETSWLDSVLISADGATSALLARDLVPHIIVTDLDGDTSDQMDCLERGTVMFLHGHADNVGTLRTCAPELKGRVIGTTQVSPYEGGHLDNFGGFSDGDRAVFIAEHFGASAIILLGFNFNEVGEKIGEGGIRSDLTEEQEDWKFRKLTWASVLLGLVTKPQPISYSDRHSLLRQVLESQGPIKKGRLNRDL